MTPQEAIKHGKEQLDIFGGEHQEFIEMAIKALEQQSCEDKGKISDGYHTFNQLYHQRAILFATIVNQNKDNAWKSFKHSDGNYCFDSNGEWFIVGVDTPQGSYTYHYAKEYWDYFDCQELKCGKEWDGHTEEDVTRLLSLEQEPCEDAISRQALLEEIKNGIKAGNYEEGYEEYSHINDMDDIIECIKYADSIQPKPKTGHWIDIMVGDMPAQACDQCNTFYPLAYTGGGHKYCPNCGAKMESEVEE